jgi:hypothetical protein
VLIVTIMTRSNVLLIYQTRPAKSRRRHRPSPLYGVYVHNRMELKRGCTKLAHSRLCQRTWGRPGRLHCRPKGLSAALICFVYALRGVGVAETNPWN